MGFISRIEERKAEIGAQIAALVAERADLEAALRVFARLGDTFHPQPASPAGLPGATAPGSESTAPAPASANPMTAPAKLVAEEPLSNGSGGVQDRCESTPPTNSPEGASDAGGSTPLADRDRGETQVRVLPGAGESDAKGGPTGMGRSDGGESTASASGEAPNEASPAPTIASRLRALNAEHPELNTREVAERLDLTLAQVRTNSHVHHLAWAPSDARTLPRPGLNARVVDLNLEHPDWTDQQIAAELECEPAYVRTTARRQNLTLGTKHAQQSPADARSPVPAPNHATQPERPPQPARAPIAQPSGTGSAVVTKPMARAPKGTRFNLRNDAGLYLHYGCENMTSDRAYAWEGSADQLLACRKKFPLATDLTERVVERAPARAVA